MGAKYRGICIILIFILLFPTFSLANPNEGIKTNFYANGNLIASVKDKISGDGNVTFYNQDRLGSNRITTDKDGNILGQFKSYPYGQPFIKDNVDYPFTGKEQDDESEFYYFGARHYDSDTGRFIQVDPMSYSGGNLPYSYVGNNPIGFVDESGTSIEGGDWYMVPYGGRDIFGDEREGGYMQARYLSGDAWYEQAIAGAGNAFIWWANFMSASLNSVTDAPLSTVMGRREDREVLFAYMGAAGGAYMSEVSMGTAGYEGAYLSSRVSSLGRVGGVAPSRRIITSYEGVTVEGMAEGSAVPRIMHRQFPVGRGFDKALQLSKRELNALKRGDIFEVNTMFLGGPKPVDARAYVYAIEDRVYLDLYYRTSRSGEFVAGTRTADWLMTNLETRMPAQFMAAGFETLSINLADVGGFSGTPIVRNRFDMIMDLY